VIAVNGPTSPAARLADPAGPTDPTAPDADPTVDQEDAVTEPVPRPDPTPVADEAARPPVIIEADHVSKVYETRSGERVLALRDASLRVRRGEFVSLVGPSGCGKTTMLKIIAGLYPRSLGSVRVEGREVTEPDDNVALVFQSPVLLPWRTVLKNVMLPGELRGHDRAERRERAHALLELVGLAGFENKLPKELSGGMRQRAAIARALASGSDILLMDEPFGAVDAFTRDILNIELLRIWEQEHKTVVFVTHSISEAVLLSDRVVVMGARPGHVIADVEVPLGRPRSLEDLAGPAAGDCANHIRHLLTRPDGTI